MKRPLELFAVAALLATSLAQAPPASAQADRVADLAGTWTCREPYGALSRVVYRAENGGIVADETPLGDSHASAAQDRFTPDPAGGWRVERTSARGRFTGHAPAWTADPWIVTATGTQGEIRYTRANDGTLQRTMAVVPGRPYAGDVCAKGDAPPDPALCALHDTPVSVVHAVEPQVPATAQFNGVRGIVRVLVALDADGHVVSTSVQQSPSVLLNASALEAARSSTYRPALHDCKPVPSQYVFSVDYNG
jgi:TonB family protein